MTLELILAMSVAANVVIGIRLYKLERKLNATDFILLEVMEEGAPKIYAHYEKWHEKYHSKQ